MNRIDEIVRTLLESEEDDFKEVYTGAGDDVQYLPLGSVIHGTTNPEDLIPAFLDTLESINPGKADRLRENYADEIAANDHEFCWEALLDALQAHTPPYTYFGSHPGDGSDFGVWVSVEALDEGLRYEDEKLQSMRKGERMPQGSDYVVVTDAAGRYIELLDGSTGEQIWAQ